MFLDNVSAEALQRHVAKLLSVSESLHDWLRGEFGSIIAFSDHATLNSVRAVWLKYAETLANRDSTQYRADFESALKITRELQGNCTGKSDLIYGAARAAAPLGMHTLGDGELKKALQAWWETGTTGGVPAGTTLPNPLFAATLSEHAAFSYTYRPILSYHLATAKAHLAETSPLKIPDSEQNGSTVPSLVAAAYSQFTEWTQAFIELAPQIWKLEFIAADCLALCHTLQHYHATGNMSANFYRRPLGPERLELDKASTASLARNVFDVIDTSNLGNSVGGLDLLVSASPLLKDAPWATLYTLTTHDGIEEETRNDGRLLCGPLVTVSTLLGISPVEYWTNATVGANVDEYMLSAVAAHESVQEPGIHRRLSWKSTEHMSGQLPKTRLRVREDDMVAFLHTVHKGMFCDELKSASKEEPQPAATNIPYPKYHCGSFAAFIKRLHRAVDFDVEAVCKQLLQIICQPQLSVEMSRHGLYAQPSLAEEVHPQRLDTKILSKWPDLPDIVSITISVPKSHWKNVYSTARVSNTAVTVQGVMTAVKDGATIFQNVFDDVHVVFGTTKTVGERGNPGFSVVIKEDQLGGAGESDLIATFPILSEWAQWDPNCTRIGLGFKNTTQNVDISVSPLSLSRQLETWSTVLNDEGHVYITKYPPGQLGHPVYNSLEPKVLQQLEDKEYTSQFTVDLDAECQINSMTGHLKVLSTEAKRLLAEKAAVDVQKISPFVFEITIGSREAVYLLHFPVPVVKEDSKTRVARTSSYIEVIARLADPATAQTLGGFIFPTTLAKDDGAMSLDGVVQTVPVTFNIPHLNLDTLPILDPSDKDRLSFLTTLASSTFSVRERKLREAFLNSNEPSLAVSVRMNFKESLFTLFMLASGLQGGQTGLFAIDHPGRGGIHMLLFVSALRLDPANATVVLDAAVIPFTQAILASGQLDSFLLILRTLECCTITVDDEELVLWKKALPALVERCRTWHHTPPPQQQQCEYALPWATIPLSSEPGRRVLCSCGEGQLPRDFINLPEWEAAARVATRVAISPVFAVSLVEKVVDPDMLREAVVGAAGSRVGGDRGALGGETVLRCRSCGVVEAKGGGALKKCMRCLKVRYCSTECQKKDWKKHRMECEEAGKYIEK